MHSPRSKVIEISSEIPLEQINPSDTQILTWIGSKKIENSKELTMFKSKITSRSAAFTDVMGKDNVEELNCELTKLFDFVDPRNLIIMKLKIGLNPKIQLTATTFLPKAHSNKAMMLRRNFYLSDHKINESDIISFDIPTYPKRQVIVDPRPKERTTYVMGIDYFGEQKMANLRMAMEIMRKDKGGLGLHAGSKTYNIINGHGLLKEKGVLIFGLSGTGKTTLTCHDHGLKGEEGVKILQDDINFITGEGETFGSEYGFYVKTDQCPEHELITQAVLAEGSILENVAVDSNGNIAWKDFTHTYNGRAIVPRSALKGSSDDIDLPKLDVILFNTRRPELPPIGKLISPAQAAAYYGLGESIITSAEDPDKAGQSKRVVGFDPFILGEESVNINRMKSILLKNPETTCYIVNTGYVGDESNNITVEDTLSCIENTLRGKIDWKMDEVLGYEVPKDISKTNWKKLDPRNYFGEENFKILITKLREERKAHLRLIVGIEKDIIEAL